MLLVHLVKSCQETTMRPVLPKDLAHRLESAVAESAASDQQQAVVTKISSRGRIAVKHKRCIMLLYLCIKNVLHVIYIYTTNIYKEQANIKPKQQKTLVNF